MSGRRPATQVLRALGLLTAEVQQWLSDEEVVTLDDLAMSFTSAQRVMDEAPFMTEAWAAAAARQSEAWRGKAGLKVLLQGLREAGRAIAGRAPAGAKSSVKSKLPRRTGKPRAKPVVKAKAVDKATRTKAAVAAVELSLSWAPSAGLAQGLKQDDPLLDVVRDVHTHKLSLFEAKGVWGAINNWKAWDEHLSQYPRAKEPAARRVLLASFIQSRPAATGPLASWNKFDFTKRHMKADIPLEDVPKPAKGAGPDGAVKQNTQAVAMPPEYLMAYEEALQRMVAANDWRRGPLACSLQVAYALIRPVHMGRSCFTHKSKVSFWLEAYRGKGKREGARRAFAYAMPRWGLTNFDVAQVIYDIWEHWSHKAGYPLDYIIMDPETGTQMESNHLQAVMRTVAEGFIGDPTQLKLIQPYSNRRFGGTLTSITETPPKDIVDYGGWAGVPDLAKITTEASEVLVAWKRSMPHLYCDTRSEHEERQKLLHLSMLRFLVVELCRQEGRTTPVTWEAIQRVSVTFGSEGKTLTVVRQLALEEVAKDLKDVVVEEVYGTTTPRRRQFFVQSRGKVLPLRTVQRTLRKRAKAKPAPAPIPTPGTPFFIEPVVEPIKSPGRGDEVLQEVSEAIEGDEQPTGQAAAEPATASPVPAEWVCTLGSIYIHRITVGEQGIFTECKWRKGPSQRKPINPDRIIWRGAAEAARTVGIPPCPDRACAL